MFRQNLKFVSGARLQTISETAMAGFLNPNKKCGFLAASGRILLCKHGKPANLLFELHVNTQTPTSALNPGGFPLYQNAWVRSHLPPQTPAD
jgi:hypothetical protein